MTPIPFTFWDWLILWAVLCLLAGVGTWGWYAIARPLVADILNWPDIPPHERIPPLAWMGVFIFIAVFGGLMFIGSLFGY